ncbi:MULTISPECIES: NAD(P)-binding protein [unclassified Bradyrhizobium]|uniref:NAD(P)-binding protein n=1 Tax=unclassified Bradyrhizobium TaxID=2631580 RepID=UPI001FFE307C|nr:MULTISPECIES: NAD(P)-binding protein [unclassified Bradyrhizobium]UPJ79495.1 FAD-dependent oxidoreductase [Bradyrhizobium sp. 184]UPJ87291.1 FAD-dependent oxidoreductase [Bradyrhizobium sp. 183]UPJ95051.1 FAD-dependent oxidoreductase [Bradyrhizobium sp. 172]
MSKLNDNEVDNAWWRRVLEAATTEYENVYSASFFARQNISIVDQQQRALKLCYALSHLPEGKITNRSHIGIVGAGFAGLTCAVALAMRHNCTVSIFERDGELLKKFREASFRYISPLLNSRAEIDPHDYEGKSERTMLPFLNWSANFAPIVSQEVIRKFEHYRRYSNISLHLGEEVSSIRGSLRKKPEIHTLTGVGLNRVRRNLLVDVAIVATGFGAEKRSSRTNDVSYWHSGNPEFYRPVIKKRGQGERVLISGNGDSGVIELAHYLISEFNHSELPLFVPGRTSDGAPFTAPISSYGLDFRKILDEFHPAAIDVPGPIIWYFQYRFGKRQRSLHPRFNLGSNKMRACGRLIYEEIDKHLKLYEPGDALPAELLEQIDLAVTPLVRNMASYDIHSHMKKLSYSAITQSYIWRRELKRDIKSRIRNNFEIVVEGLTPTIYSPGQAPQNWFLLRLLHIFGEDHFSYRQVAARTEKTDLSKFDRVVIRRGPSFATYKELAKPKAYRPANVLIDDPEIWWRWTQKASKNFEDGLNDFFRTPRWSLLLRKVEPIEDHSGKEASDSLDLGLVDRLFLRAWTEGNLGPALRDYRQIKRLWSRKDYQAKLVARMKTLSNNSWDW